MRLAFATVALALLAACSTAPQDADEVAQAQVVQAVSADDIPPPPPAPPPAPEPVPGPSTFVYDGELTQGGWLRGQAPGGALSARLDDTPLVLDEDGRFFAAFDRDAGASATLVAQFAGGRRIESPLSIAPREWNIERVNVARRPSGSSEAWWKRREPEYNAIVAARAKDTGATGWRQDFVWPVKGRISGRFGRQRIYRGEPGSYHSGIDIAPGNGVPFVSPADGVVVLATDREFSLEGNLLIIDHGNGLNSAFLHCSRIAVREGEAVSQGQYVGNVGATGRATGPHLHWSLKWRDARLDPLLFTGPMS